MKLSKVHIFEISKKFSLFEELAKFNQLAETNSAVSVENNLLNSWWLHVISWSFLKVNIQKVSPIKDEDFREKMMNREKVKEVLVASDQSFFFESMSLFVLRNELS